jgi:hypothetical protein
MQLTIKRAALALLFASWAGAKPFPSVQQLPVQSELPDPFHAPGQRTRVTRAPEWNACRASWVQQILHYQYGALPRSRVPVEPRGVSTKRLAFGVEHSMQLRTGPVHVEMVLTTPAGRGPFPVILDGDLGWHRLDEQIVRAAVKRGYAVCEFDRTDVAPDAEGPCALQRACPEWEGGRLSAWAWGFHRVLDYLETRTDIDRRRVAVTGHSRGGKAALLAGALDPRIRVTNPNNSGCGGAGCFRVLGPKSEDLAAILREFPFWFSPRLQEFVGHTRRLPFDQHIVKALVAPRPLLSTEALGDLHANPSGTQHTYLAAREVYAFLGAEENIGIHFRPGRHQHGYEDWLTLLDFTDKHLRGKPVRRRFDKLAFPVAKFSWQAPAAR